MRLDTMEYEKQEDHDERAKDIKEKVEDPDIREGGNTHAGN